MRRVLIFVALAALGACGSDDGMTQQQQQQQQSFDAPPPVSMPDAATSAGTADAVPTGREPDAAGSICIYPPCDY